MTYTYKITHGLAAVVILALVALTFGAQIALAESDSDFDAPDAKDRPIKVTPFKSLRKYKKEVGEVSQNGNHDSVNKREKLKETREKRDDFRENVRNKWRNAKEDRRDFKKEGREKRDDFRNKFLEKKKEFQGAEKEARDDLRSEVKKRRAEIKAELDAAKTPGERKDILEKAREERKEMRRKAIEKRDEFKSRAKDIQSELREKRAEFKSEIKTKVGERIKSNLENILNRISNALEKFTSVLDRVNNKIAELEADGVNTTEASASALVAEQAIQDASAALSEARTTFERALASDSPRKYLTEMRTAIRNSATTVKAANRALRDAIKELKKLIRTNNNSNSVEVSPSTGN